MSKFDFIWRRRCPHCKAFKFDPVYTLVKNWSENITKVLLGHECGDCRHFEKKTKWM